MDVGTIARGMMACSSSHASGCPMQRPAPLGRVQPIVKPSSAVPKVCVALTVYCTRKALAVTLPVGSQGAYWSSRSLPSSTFSFEYPMIPPALICLCICQLQRRSRRSAALCVQATVAERLEVSASPYIHEPGKGLGFYTGTDGYLYVDNLRIDDIRAQV